MQVPDAVADPQTVMIHLQHAIVAHRAVVGAVGLECRTLPAIAWVAIALALDNGQRLDGHLHVLRLITTHTKRRKPSRGENTEHERTRAEKMPNIPLYQWGRKYP